MKLIRTAIASLKRYIPEIDTLSPRLLADAGLDRAEVRSAPGSALMACISRTAIDMISER